MGFIEYGNYNSLGLAELVWEKEANAVVNITDKPSLENLKVGRLAVILNKVNFTGPFGSEEKMFSLAAQLEKSNPWFNKRPVFQ